MSLFVTKITLLRQLIVKRLTLQEIKTLADDLEVDFEEIPGKTKTEKTTEVIGIIKNNLLRAPTSEGFIQIELSDIERAEVRPLTGQITIPTAEIITGDEENIKVAASSAMFSYRRFGRYGQLAIPEPDFNPILEHFPGHIHAR